MSPASQRQMELEYKWRLTAAYDKEIHPMWSKKAAQTRGGGAEGGPAFWLAGELRRYVPAGSCQTNVSSAKVRSLCVMHKQSAVYLLRGYNWRGAFVGLS